MSEFFRSYQISYTILYNTIPIDGLWMPLDCFRWWDRHNLPPIIAFGKSCQDWPHGNLIPQHPCWHKESAWGCASATSATCSCAKWSTTMKMKPWNTMKHMYCKYIWSNDAPRWLQPRLWGLSLPGDWWTGRMFQWINDDVLNPMP